eukprot:12490513-Ditylum_brightwellii.AAC.1
MTVPHVGIYPKYLNKAIRELNSYVALVLEGICNNHITLIVFSDQRDVPPPAKPADLDTLREGKSVPVQPINIDN